MAKIDFFLIVLLIPCHEILCSVPKNDSSIFISNSIKSPQQKLNATVSKLYNKKRDKKQSKEKTSSSTGHEIPYSEHEEPRNVSTRPKYTSTGQLIHPKKKEEILSFVPKKLYAQVREKHTVKRVPQRYAVEEATTDEEKSNANRLREVVTNKKSNILYTEEGYEDSAYDHAGHIRDADFKESFGRKLKNKFDDKGESIYPIIVNNVKETNDVAEAESGKVRVDEDRHPQKLVINGIQNLENDIIREIEQTDRKAEEYHDKVSQKKSQKSSDSKEDDFNYDEYDKNYDESSSDNRSENSNSKIAEVSSEDELTSTKKYPKYLLETEEIRGDRSSNSRSEEDSDNKSIRSNSSGGSSSSAGSSASAEDNSSKINAEINTETYITTIPSRKKLTRYRGGIKYGSKEQNQENSNSVEYVKSNIYKTTAAPITESNYRTFASILPEYTTIENFDEMNLGDVLWKNFKKRQKQRASKDLTKTKETETNGQNPLILENNDTPHFEKLVSRPRNLEPKPNNYALLDDSYPTIASPLDFNRIEVLTMKPFKSSVSNTGRYEVTEENTTPLYTTQFYDSTDSSEFTTQKLTEYDHNPFLSPFAKQFDKKLKRYHVVSREKPESVTVRDELQFPKNKNGTINYYSKNNKSKKYKPNNYKLRPMHYKQKIVPSENNLRIMKPPKPTMSFIMPAKISYKRPIFEPEEPYDPILNNLILPRIIRSQFYPNLGLSPRGVRPDTLYPKYKHPIARKRDYFTNNMYSPRMKPNKRRYKRSLISQKFNNTENIENKKTYAHHADFLRDLSVVDKELEKRFPEKNYTDTNKSEENGKGVVEVEIPEIDEFPDEKESHSEDYEDPEEETLDKEKYPYYENDLVKQNSILKYILNPNYVPKKTFGGMEFYDSRILKCSEVEPDLSDITSLEEEPTTTKGYNEDLSRLTGLGDKLDCFKAKYFDPNPLDNPLFMEKRIDHLDIPIEINPQQFSSKISDWSGERDEYIQQKLSKAPEYEDGDLSLESDSSRKRKSKIKIRRRKKPSKKKKKKRRPLDQPLVPLRLYGNQVYDDVMGIIKYSKPRKNYHKKHYANPSLQKIQLKHPNEIPKEVATLKLRFIPKYSRAKKSLNQIDSADSSIINIPTSRLPNKVRVLKGGPYSSIRIAKPRGSKLKINYRELSGTRKHKKEQHQKNFDDHYLSKRSVKNPQEKKLRKELSTIRTNSHQLNANPIVLEELIGKNDQKKYLEPVKEDYKHNAFLSDSIQSSTDLKKKNPANSSTDENNTKQTITEQPSLRIIVGDKNYAKVKTPPTETSFRVNHEYYYTTQKPKVYQEIERTENNESKLIKVSPKVEENSKESTNRPISKNHSEEDVSENSRDYHNSEKSSAKKDQTDSDSSEESSSSSRTENSSEESHSDEKNDFQRFDSRPYSPPEYYEDPKYSDLGPRINKPAFYHPRFRTPKYELYKFGKPAEDVSSESYESEESVEKNRYTDPWDRHDNEESKHFVHTINRYEYPWERRERLAKERRKKKRLHSSEEDEEEAASSEDNFFYHKRPWKIYKAPKYTPKNKDKYSNDNAEDTTNIKVAQTKLIPNITVSKVNRTIIEIIKNPILSEKFATTPSLLMISSVNETINPLIANASQGKTNIEILKTNPRARKMSNANLKTTTTASSVTNRRKVRLRNNLSTTTESSTLSDVRIRRRLVRTTTVSPKTL